MLPAYLAGSDVFVFPIRTDTFGVVQLEALACGVPVAAFPSPAQDVIGREPIGWSTRICARPAWGRCMCRAKPVAACAHRSWEASARQFRATSSGWRSTDSASRTRPEGGEPPLTRPAMAPACGDVRQLFPRAQGRRRAVTLREYLT